MDTLVQVVDSGNHVSAISVSKLEAGFSVTWRISSNNTLLVSIFTQLLLQVPCSIIPSRALIMDR